MSIGSVYLHNCTEEPLDSYQEINLDRLRGKWADALMHHHDCISWGSMPPDPPQDEEHVLLV